MIKPAISAIAVFVLYMTGVWFWGIDFQRSPLLGLNFFMGLAFAGGAFMTTVRWKDLK